MGKLLLRAAITCFCVALLAGWRGPLRSQDLKVYRISLPALTGVDSQTTWKSKAVRSLGGKSDEHSRYQVEIDFIAVSDPTGQKGITARYDLDLHSARLISVSPAVYHAPEAGQRGVVVNGSAPRALLREVSNAQAVAQLESEGKTYRYPRVDAQSEVSLSLFGLTSVGDKEFLTVERVQKVGQPLRQYISLLQLPSTESPPDADLRALTLVDLSEAGFTAEPAGIALLADNQTVALLSAASPEQDSEQADQSMDPRAPQGEIWLVRLPGTLTVAITPVYIAAVLAIVVAVVLLVFGFLRK